MLPKDEKQMFMDAVYRVLDRYENQTMDRDAHIVLERARNALESLALEVRTK